MTDYITEQLARYGYTDTAGKSRKELTNELARLRALEININAPENGYF
ncbi:hypothetical protein JYK21_07265 [Ralstonia pickettii]|nr:hypothetical protein [Ralstonia pickettii]